MILSFFFTYFLDFFLLLNFLILLDLIVSECTAIQKFYYFLLSFYAILITVSTVETAKNVLFLKEDQSYNVDIPDIYHLVFGMTIFKMIKTGGEFFDLILFFSFLSMIGFVENDDQLILFTILLCFGRTTIEYFGLFLLENNNDVNAINTIYKMSTFIWSPLLLYNALLWVEQYIYQNKLSSFFGFTFCLLTLYLRQFELSKIYFEFFFS